MSASAMYRLTSAQRGAQGFFEYASELGDDNKHNPIYIYDRLDEPSRGMLEENLAYAEGGEMCVTFATGMAAISACVGMLCEQQTEIVAPLGMDLGGLCGQIETLTFFEKSQCLSAAKI